MALRRFAGFGLLCAVEEATADEVRRLYETDVFGLLNVTRAVLPSMHAPPARPRSAFAPLRSAPPLEILAPSINQSMGDAMKNLAKRVGVGAALACGLLALSACGGGSDDSGSGSSSGSASSSGSSSGSSSSSGKDALDYAQVAYQFSCQGVAGTKTVNVSNGPCVTQQKAFAKATSCNEYDANYTFNSVGKPFYQCLVNNTTNADIKSTYQKSLTYYSGK